MLQVVAQTHDVVEIDPRRWERIALAEWPMRSKTVEVILVCLSGVLVAVRSLHYLQHLVRTRTKRLEVGCEPSGRFHANQPPCSSYPGVAASRRPNRQFRVAGTAGIRRPVHGRKRTVQPLASCACIPARIFRAPKSLLPSSPPLPSFTPRGGDITRSSRSLAIHKVPLGIPGGYPKTNFKRVNYW